MTVVRASYMQQCDRCFSMLFLHQIRDIRENIRRPFPEHVLRGRAG